MGTAETRTAVARNMGTAETPYSWQTCLACVERRALPPPRAAAKPVWRARKDHVPYRNSMELQLQIPDQNGVLLTIRSKPHVGRGGLLEPPGPKNVSSWETVRLLCSDLTSSLAVS